MYAFNYEGIDETWQMSDGKIMCRAHFSSEGRFQQSVSNIRILKNTVITYGFQRHYVFIVRSYCINS